MPKEVKSAKKLSIVDNFGNFLATNTNFVCRSDSVRQTIFLFVAVIQCNKLNFCLSQWLSATKKIDKKNYGEWRGSWSGKYNISSWGKYNISSWGKYNISSWGNGIRQHSTLLQFTACKANTLCCALNCTALNYTALNCTALNCTALNCTALNWAALSCTALQCTAVHCTALHCTALHCTALHCTALHCTALHCTALYITSIYNTDCMALYGTVWLQDCSVVHCTAALEWGDSGVRRHRILGDQEGTGGNLGFSCHSQISVLYPLATIYQYVKYQSCIL